MNIEMQAVQNCGPQSSEDILAKLRVNGRFFKVGALRDEWYNEITDPESILSEIRRRRTPIDVFTFLQRPPVESCLSYHKEMDHVAAIPITTFANWWEKQVIKKIRKNVRRSGKYGVTVKVVPFDNTLVAAIEKIYGEYPIRDGRRFPHYNDDFETCKRKHESYADRSDFIAAFYKGEIIGFIKLIYAGKTARTMQNISMIRYRDFSPSNAMLAKAVDLCASKGINYLVFGRLSYGKKGGEGLEEFKVANGFVRLEYPRYYVPLTSRGRVAIKYHLDRSPIEYLPKWLVQMVRSFRTSWYGWRYPKPELEVTPNTAPSSD